MDITRLSAPVGALINDVDVRSLDEKSFARINTLFCKHHVLVFPGQKLGPEDQIKFASRWGNLIPFPYMSLPDFPDLIELKNRGKEKDINQHWH